MIELTQQTNMAKENELADIPSDGDNLEDIAKEQENENSKGSQPEKNEEEEKEEDKEEEEEEKEEGEEKEEKEEKEVPFHKHPRFKALVTERNQYKEELEKMREDMDSKFSEIEDSQSKGTKIPAWFSELYGDNKEAWGKYQVHDKATRAEIKKELLEELAPDIESLKETKYQQDFNKWSDGEMDKLEEDGNKFKRNELMKFMLENPIYKANGKELNFEKALELLNLTKKKDPKKSNARKEIVADEKTKAEPGAKKWFTPKDIVGW